MVKVFVSQPMTGLSVEQIIEVREGTKEKLNKIINDEYEIIDNLQLDCNYDKSLYYMANDIRLLADSDIVYFVKGWEKSRGCKIEFEIASNYDYKCIFE